MSNTYTVWGVNGATRLAMNQHHMAGVLRMRGGLGDPPPARLESTILEEEERERQQQELQDRMLDLATRDQRQREAEATAAGFFMPVREVQEALKRRGHDPGRIDGQWGPASRAAMRAFWRAEADRDEAAVFAQPARTQAEISARVDRAFDARKYWEFYGPKTGADNGATQIGIPTVGPFRERLFAAGAPARRPPPTPPRPPAPEPDREEPRIVKKEETDWTTWILAGTGIAVAGVALWAVFFRKRRKG